jgi:hypothetical protein
MALFVSIQSLYYNNKGLHSNFIGHNNISFRKKMLCSVAQNMTNF